MHLCKQANKGELMEMKFCQSCGMPLTPEILGTNADGSKNEEYKAELRKYFPTLKRWR